MHDSLLFQKLLDISRQMAETRALDPLLTYAVDVALDLFGGERGYIVLVEEDETLSFRVRRDFNGADIAEPERKISYTILRKVVSTQEPVVTASAIEHPDFSRAESVYDLQLRSVMVAPLVTNGRTVGAIYIENNAADAMFTPNDLEILTFFASQAAVAIENAMLNDRLEAMLNQRAEEYRQASEHLQQEVMTIGQLDRQTLHKAVEEERMRVIANFITDASHQFRTPLAVINTSTDLLRRKLDTDQYGNYLGNIQQQVKTIVQLVETLELMVKLDSNVAPLDQRVDLAQVAEDMVNVKDARSLSKRQSLSLNCQIPSAPVHGNLELLRQALGHLIDNSIAFTPPSGQITVSLFEADSSYVLEIKDTGTGIDPEHLPNIFQRFYRSDEAGTTRGLGLGLSIVQKILDLHEARIEVESDPNRGSIFRMVFTKD